MKSSHFELLFLFISTYAPSHMTRYCVGERLSRPTKPPCPRLGPSVAIRRDLEEWKNLIFNLFLIKNALTVSFFKAVYIIKWRSRVHDAVMTPTQMISDFYSVSREWLNSCTFILYFSVHICTLWTDLGLIIYFLCFFKIPTIFSTLRLHWRVGELELEKTSK